jgi:hypothetical protein
MQSIMSLHLSLRNDQAPQPLYTYPATLAFTYMTEMGNTGLRGNGRKKIVELLVVDSGADIFA